MFAFLFELVLLVYCGTPHSLTGTFWRHSPLNQIITLLLRLSDFKEKEDSRRRRVPVPSFLIFKSLLASFKSYTNNPWKPTFPCFSSPKDVTPKTYQYWDKAKPRLKWWIRQCMPLLCLCIKGTLCGMFFHILVYHETCDPENLKVESRCQDSPKVEIRSWDGEKFCPPAV